MSGKWIVPLMIAAVAGVVAYGIARRTVCGKCDCVERMRDASSLAETLKLSEVQATEVKRLHTALAATLDDCCARHCTARAHLRTALAAGTNGSAQAEAVLGEMCRAYEQSERAALNNIRAVRALLDTEQQKRFDAMLSDCMCDQCGAGGSGCRETAPGLSVKPD
jgi:hypothetical protein